MRVNAMSREEADENEGNYLLTKIGISKIVIFLQKKKFNNLNNFYKNSFSTIYKTFYAF